MKNTWKLAGTVIIIILLLIEFKGAAPHQEIVKNNWLANVNKSYDQRVKQPEIQGYELILSNAPKGVYVYGKKIPGAQYFENVIIKSGASQKEFKWKATTKNPSLMFADLTGDRQDEIIIVFTTAFGTGYLQSQIHVLDNKLTKEIPVDDPVASSQRLITSRIQGNDIVFKASGKEYRARPNVGPAGIEADFRSMQFGNVVSYSLVNGRLVAKVAVQTNPSSFLGEFNLTYSYKNGRLTPEVTSFIKLL